MHCSIQKHSHPSLSTQRSCTISPRSYAQCSLILVECRPRTHRPQRSLKSVLPSCINSELLLNRHPFKFQNFNDWKVERDPPPDIHIVFFSNQKQEYYSYNPPVGFTAEEIMQFPGAKESLGTVEKVKELLELKGKLGTLDTTDHWKPSDVKQ